MNIKKTTLAVAVSTVFALGAADKADAAIYAGAYLEVDNLVIGIFANGTVVVPTNFDFRTSTASDLNGASGPGSIASCAGLVGVQECGKPGGVGPFVINSLVSGIGAPIHTENTFALLGPGGGEYGSADNVIWDAELVGDAKSHTQGIAEAELQSGETAGATSTIRSTTNFTFEFTLPVTGSLTLAFDADPYLFAENIDPTAASGTASATLATSFSLSGGGGTVSWSPLGLGAGSDGNCSTSGGFLCSVVADSQSLNLNATAPFGGTDSFSVGFALTPFGISVTNLAAGVYALTLSQTQEVNVSRQAAAVPEPGALLLLGTALAGLGLARRFKFPVA